MERYLRPTPDIDSDNRALIKKARSLTKGQRETAERAKSLFYFVRDGIKYNPYRFTLAPGDFRASDTLIRGDGFCVQKAVLLIALARAIKIPGRLLLTDIRNHLAPQRKIEVKGTNLFLHGYCELHIEGKWVKVTPAIDLVTCVENRFVPVEFDGRNDAMFHTHNQDGKLHIEYVTAHGDYDDVPLDEMIQAVTMVDGPEYAELAKTGRWVYVFRKSGTV